MDEHLRAVSAIVILLLLICLAVLLRRLGVVDEHHGKTFSRLVTQVTLPALILFSMARAEVLFSEIELALAMMAAGLLCLGLGWGIARALALERAKAGPLILAAGFGNTSLLGFAMVSAVFPDDPRAMTEAVVISALGVQPLLFTLGTLIAIYYGDSETARSSQLADCLAFFRSPIFLAFVAGLLLSELVGPSTHPIYRAVMDGIHIAGAANTFLVTLTVGLFLSVRGLRETLGVVVLVAAVKLVVMPSLVWLPTHLMASAPWQVEVAVLEAAMPSSMLAVVLASAYGCDAGFACRMVIVTTVLAVITVPVMFAVLT